MGLPGYVLAAINIFENAVREHTLKGGKCSSQFDAVEMEYTISKNNLKAIIESIIIKEGE